MILVPRWLIPMSYTSGKAMQMRTSTLAGSFVTDWYSPPR